METKRRSKLAIIGAGSVGSSMAYASLIRGSADDIVLYDLAAEKVAAEVADLSHGTQFTGHSDVSGGDDVAVCKDATVVVITAGAKQRPDQTRLDLAAVNVDILKDLMPKLVEQAPDALYVLVTNPCDVLTVAAQRISGLPTSQVFSTGTMLDTSRLRWVIAQEASVALSNVHASIVGEHGDSEFAMWSNARIGAVPITEWVNSKGERLFSESRLEEIQHQVMRSAYSIIQGKGATNYAIGLTGARLVEVLHSTQRSVLPVSSVFSGQFGIDGVALSLPTMVSSKGVERVTNVPMTSAELTLLRRSADAIRATLKSLGF